MVKLAVFVAVCAAGLAMAPPPAAACRDHCRIRAGVLVAVPPFGVELGWPRARIVIRGPIMAYGVADRGPPPPPPPEAPEPPPEAPEYYTPQPDYAAPAAAVYSASRPREPSVGVGVRASALRIGRDGPEAAGFGLLLRFKARPVELELDIGRDEYRQGVERADTRVGGSLYVPLVSGSLIPFLVVGGGINFSHFEATGDELHQGFIAGGGGLGLKLGSHLVIAADARYMLRRFFDSEAKVDLQGVSVTSDEPHGVRDEAVEGRLNAVLYF